MVRPSAASLAKNGSKRGSSSGAPRTLAWICTPSAPSSPTARSTSSRAPAAQLGHAVVCTPGEVGGRVAEHVEGRLHQREHLDVVLELVHHPEARVEVVQGDQRLVVLEGPRERAPGLGTGAVEVGLGKDVGKGVDLQAGAPSGAPPRSRAPAYDRGVPGARQGRGCAAAGPRTGGRTRRSTAPGCPGWSLLRRRLTAARRSCALRWCWLRSCSAAPP